MQILKILFKISKLNFLILLPILILLFLQIKYYSHRTTKSDFEKSLGYRDCGIYGCIDDYLDFEGFDNVNGTKDPIVPDIVHLLYLRHTQLRFYQVICIFSIYLNHRPSLIYIHCDDCDFHGKYWDWLKRVPELWNIIKIHKIPFHETIFGVMYGWLNYHRSDIWRLQLLMNYGGMFLDNDIYVISSLHKYRHFEMTFGWEKKNQIVGVQVLVAHRNARLLKAHFDSYRYRYSPKYWYWNAGFVPAIIFTETKNQTLAHTVMNKFGVHNLEYLLYHNLTMEWKNYETIHLLVNHRQHRDNTSTIKEFDEINILTYNRTFGIMCRDILKRLNFI